MNTGLRRMFAIPVALIILSGLTGCSAGELSAGDGAAAWTDPAWVAGFRHDMDIWQMEQVACFAEQGVTVTLAASGGVHLPIVTGDDPPGTIDLIEAAMWHCFDEVGRFGPWEVALDQDVYQRFLDSRDCLITHGYEVPPPPSFDVWRQQDGNWFPHMYAFEHRLDEGFIWTYGAWRELNETCPQPGPGIFCPGNLADTMAAVARTTADPRIQVPEFELAENEAVTPPGGVTMIWAEGDLELIPDPCDENESLRTGRTYFIVNPNERGTRVGVQFDMYDLDFWLAGQWPSDAPPMSELIEMRAWHSHGYDDYHGIRVNLPLGYRIEVRAAGGCEPGMDIVGQFRWPGGEPEFRDPFMGLGPPDLRFADTPLGHKLREILGSADA